MSTTTSALESEVIDLLRARRAGDPSAGRRLFELLYSDLRWLASRRMTEERREHTHAATSLVHEVFLRLEGSGLDCEDRREFLALAATVMKRILIDSARRRILREDFPALEGTAGAPDAPMEQRILSLGRAMERLERADPELARVAELRFLLGMDVEAVARTLEISTASVQRGWRSARAFLKRAIEKEECDEG